MAMASLFSPNLHPPLPTQPPKQLTASHDSLFFPSHHHKHNQRHLAPLHASPSPSASASPPINADYLGSEFGGHGVSFQGVGDSCVVKMGLDDGSTAAMMLPSGLVTSYKPRMWHGSTAEVLHTCVSQGRDGEVVVQGGVSLGLSCERGEGMPWSPSSWGLHDVRGSSEKSVQVELISVDPEAGVEIKYLVTLQQGLLGSELIITNLRSSPLQLAGSILSHFKVSTPDATYAVGLQGSNYTSRKPFQSGFSIIPPDFGSTRPSKTNQPWGQRALQGLFSGWGKIEDKDGGAAAEVGSGKDGMEGEEKDDSARMTEEMSRIYTYSPRGFTVIDRGRRNSVIVERRGFDEFYILSPGSDHEWYGKYSYLCIGPSAMLVPVTLGSQSVWTGGLYLYNPNM